MHARARSDAPNPAQRTALAVERVLRPLVRLLVGRVACIYVVDRLRRIYLEEARAWLARVHPEQRITRSRLAMLTGLDTRTIAALEDGHPPGGDTPTLPAHEICAGSVVIDRWLTDPDFLDAEGSPLQLAVLGAQRSFQALTSRAVGRNITPHTVLDQLLESGNVELDGEDRVRLVDPVYRPVRESEETALDAGSHSIARLVETVRWNADGFSAGPCRLQQDRLSARVPEARHEELQARARSLLERQIAEMECLLSEYETNDETAGTCRVGVGWYVFD